MTTSALERGQADEPRVVHRREHVVDLDVDEVLDALAPQPLELAAADERLEHAAVTVGVLEQDAGLGEQRASVAVDARHRPLHEGAHLPPREPEVGVRAEVLARLLVRRRAREHEQRHVAPDPARERSTFSAWSA